LINAAKSTEAIAYLAVALSGRTAAVTLRALSCAALSAAMLSHQPTTAAALTIELKDVAPDRIERQRQAARGALPLPGTPEVGETASRLQKLDLTEGTPVLIRIFKEESQLELWMQKGERYVLFATYPICHWSGTLGPKLVEGDKQAPEGFYTVTRRQMHRSGRWPRSLNLGFPNVYDRSMMRTGSYILVHGGCTSVGCFAMTNPVIAEVFGLVQNALKAGQVHVPVHVFPYRMTHANLEKHQNSEWANFWRNLKTGYDSFETTRLPPAVSVCNGKYSIRDGRPTEVGLSSSPLAVCGQTAQILDAEEQLQSIVSRPSRWSTLTDREQRLLGLLKAPPSQILRRRQEAIARASSITSVGKPGRGTDRASPSVSVQCNLRLASCRRHLALKQKRATRSIAEKTRKQQRRQSAKLRR